MSPGPFGGGTTSGKVADGPVIAVGAPSDALFEPGIGVTSGLVLPLIDACGAPSSRASSSWADRRLGRGTDGRANHDCVREVGVEVGTTESVLRRMPDCEAPDDSSASSDCGSLAGVALGGATAPGVAAGNPTIVPFFVVGGTRSVAPDFTVDTTFIVAPDFTVDATFRVAPDVAADATRRVAPDCPAFVVGGAGNGDAPSPEGFFFGLGTGVAMGPDTSSPRRSPHPSSVSGGLPTSSRCCH